MLLEHTREVGAGGVGPTQRGRLPSHKVPPKPCLANNNNNNSRPTA
jgi:hypothetical protein